MKLPSRLASTRSRLALVDLDAGKSWPRGDILRRDRKSFDLGHGGDRARVRNAAGPRHADEIAVEAVWLDCPPVSP